MVRGVRVKGQGTLRFVVPNMPSILCQGTGVRDGQWQQESGPELVLCSVLCGAVQRRNG
jgi:hypothetical protein